MKPLFERMSEAQAIDRAATTPGPWSISSAVHADRRNVFALEQPARMVCTLVCGSKRAMDRFEADAALIAAAPDHALIGWAMCVQDATWEEWVPFDGKGEFCFAGLRYSTRLDPFGVPEVTPAMREAITRSRTKSSEIAAA